MLSKGISQVDFAIAAGMFILFFAFLALFSTNYFSTMKNDVTIMDKRSTVSVLSEDIIGPGEPENWERTISVFQVNTAADWARSLARFSNSTIRLFSSGELLEEGDGLYANVSESEGADALEVSFPYIGIPASASIGTVRIKVNSNSTLFDSRFGEGDFADDITFFSAGREEYLEDWSSDASGQFFWWNSSNLKYRITNRDELNSLMIRLYYNPEGLGTAYFDQINITATYSSYPNYPSKIGLGSDSYRIDVLLNNTIDDFPNEIVSINFSLMDYDDIDQNSVIVYNQSGSAIACQVSDKILTFSANIPNNTQQWYYVWFSRNSTSNFSSPFCSSSISGTDNLTTANRNETLLAPISIPVLQHSKIVALNSSDYEILKGTADIGSDFHITLKDSSGNTYMDYGEDMPRKGDIYGLQRNVIFQNSTSGVMEGKIYVYVW